jgi:hypothetical protein
MNNREQFILDWCKQGPIGAWSIDLQDEFRKRFPPNNPKQWHVADRIQGYIARMVKKGLLKKTRANHKNYYHLPEVSP